jgi:hypothetical protein
MQLLCPSLALGAGVVWVVAGIDATSILAHRRLLERVNEMGRRIGTLDAAAAPGAPVLKHGPSAACGGLGRKRPSSIRDLILGVINSTG